MSRQSVIHMHRLNLPPLYRLRERGGDMQTVRLWTPPASPATRLITCGHEVQPRSTGGELSSNGLLLRRWLRSSRGVAPKKLR